MKQTNIEKLIEWMEADISSSGEYYGKITFGNILAKAKQLQQEEPRMYTQEEMDNAKADSYLQGLLEGSQ